MNLEHEENAHEAAKRHASNEFNCEFLSKVIEAKGFEKQSGRVYICILFDLLLYRHPDLTKRVFELLSMYFLRTRTVTSALQNI